MAAPMSEDEDEMYNGLNEDYYAFLNVPKTANLEEISNSYRRLSKLYHPDKHTDPIKKKDAEILFNKTKKAYEVLTDPHKRAIYDTLGIKGLETDGWEVVQRTKTPQEIREEYEKLAKEREEWRLQQRTNPKGTATVGVDATELFESYDYEDGFLPHIEINTMTISQSIEAPLSINDTVTLNGSIASQNGTGSGNIGASLRHVVSPKTWTEFEIGAGHRLFSSVKGFHTLSKRCFSSMQGILQFTPNGIRPGINMMLSRQLDTHTVGYLTWKAGLQSSMTTTIDWDFSSGHLVAAVQFGVPDTFIMLRYMHKLQDEAKLRGSLKAGTFGVEVEYGYETQVSKHSLVGASVMIGVPSGVVLKIKFHRANQRYIFPIQLSEEVLPSAIFYGTVIPIVTGYAIKMLIIRPYLEREKNRKAQKAQEANAAKLRTRKQEASAAVSLMQETYNRIKEQEENKNGLVIVQALYGKLAHVQSVQTSSEFKDEEVVDVIVPLQCLVKDSRLVITDSSKSNLPGFYDPCLGEEKHLLVVYKFRNLFHSVTISDLETLRLPKESHLQKS